MSEFGIQTPETLATELIRVENEFEENVRDIALAERLFHDDHLRESLSRPGMVDDLGRLQMDFLAEKRGLSMIERFQLALSDKYLGKIHVVELGKTVDPATSSRVDGLKDEYLELLECMQSLGIVDGELSRNDSHRTLSTRKPVTPAAIDKMKIIVRDRPLVRTRLDQNGQNVEIAIAKRMVFALPMQTVYALYANVDSMNDQNVLERVELMLEHRSGGVVPIRTAYYMSSELT